MIMTAQQLVDELTKIIAGHGKDVPVVCRNGAGDMDYLSADASVSVATGWNGETVVRIEP